MKSMDGTEGWEIVSLSSSSSSCHEEEENSNDSYQEQKEQQQQQQQRQTQQEQEESSQSIQRMTGSSPKQEQELHHQREKKENFDQEQGIVCDKEYKDKNRKNNEKDILLVDNHKSSVTNNNTNDYHHENHQQQHENHRKEISIEQIKQWHNEIMNDPTAIVAQNAAMMTSISKITKSRQIMQQNDYIDDPTCSMYTINIDTSSSSSSSMNVTDQKDSGRCWLFATLNLFRFRIRDTLHYYDHNFEFSESFLLFYHLLEQVNQFCEIVITKTIQQQHHHHQQQDNDRFLQELYDDPIDDGGDWDIALQLLLKYGIVPKSFYPETHSSSHTDELLDIINQLAIQTACQIRKSIHNNNNNNSSSNNNKKNENTTTTTATTIVNQIRQTIKKECLYHTYRILCIHLGTPPNTINWKFRNDNDDENHYHTIHSITPLEFLHRYVFTTTKTTTTTRTTTPTTTNTTTIRSKKHDHKSPPSYETYISCIQDPRHEYNELYYVPYSMTIYDCQDTRFLNLSSNEMKRLTIKMLQEHQLPVLFACNVSEERDDQYGIFDKNLYNYSDFYHIPTLSNNNNKNKYKMTKAERIEYGTPMGTHMMIFTGVDINQETKKPMKWRVENSWGTSASGQDGYYTLNDNWFHEHVYEIIIPKQYLNDHAKYVLDHNIPIPLPYWDPMQTTRKQRGSTYCGRRRPRRRFW